jgi:hypothetical protein
MNDVMQDQKARDGGILIPKGSDDSQEGARKTLFNRPSQIRITSAGGLSNAAGPSFVSRERGERRTEGWNKSGYPIESNEKRETAPRCGATQTPGLFFFGGAHVSQLTGEKKLQFNFAQRPKMRLLTLERRQRRLRAHL